MIIFTTTILALFLGWQAYMTIMANTTEQQQYRVVGQKGEVEIRFYPSATRAAVNVMSREGDYEFMRNRGFRELGGYIFGNNVRNERIAMTAPVVMDMDSTEQGLSGRMAFTMPKDFDVNAKPEPRSPFIAFSTTEPQYTASLAVGGFPRLDEMNALKERLFTALKEQGLQHTNHAEYLYYNPPTQLLGRRNEVLVRLIGYIER
ncbi:MAG: heme-binding protein [Candidatus Kapabacteria bacterium]|nr:heme-binding protein [Candidatus Kapabacteria bacterium]